MNVPLNPISREEIRKLESAILIMALFDKETLERIKNPEQRVTWLDSLYIAAAAFARSKAGMSISKIADELGVTDITIRNHLKGETKAGQLVLKIYEKLSKEGFKVELPEEVVHQYNRRIQELENKLNLVKNTLKDLLEKL